jgi:hypothetical protein
VKRAVGLAAFATEAIPAARNDPEAPVALREDADRLPGSTAVLYFAFRATCTEAAPTATLAKLKAKLDGPSASRSKTRFSGRPRRTPCRRTWSGFPSPRSYA